MSYSYSNIYMKARKSQVYSITNITAQSAAEAECAQGEWLYAGISLILPI